MIIQESGEVKHGFWEAADLLNLVIKADSFGNFASAMMLRRISGLHIQVRKGYNTMQLRIRQRCEDRSIPWFLEFLLLTWREVVFFPERS